MITNSYHQIYKIVWFGKIFIYTIIISKNTDKMFILYNLQNIYSKCKISK